MMAVMRMLYLESVEASVRAGETLYRGDRSEILAAGDRIVKAGASAWAEAAALMSFRHPNILRCLGAGQLDDGRPAFLAPRLTRLTRAAGTLDARGGVRVLTDIARGLAFLHADGQPHGDVHPENVLLDEDGSAVLADLEFLGHGGVFDYMAPELRDGGPVTLRSDMFGLGAVGWRLFTGRPPGPFDPPTAIPAALRQLLEACLSSEPGARPADAGTFLQALEEGT